MNETLILILGHSPDESVKWAFLDNGEVRLADKAENVAALALIADRARTARQIAAVVTGESAAMRAMPAPPRAAGQFRAAAGFLLEDELAEPMAGIHHTVSRNENGAGQVFAIKRSVLDSWRNAFSEMGFSPDVFAPDFSLLPAALERAVILDSPERVLGCIGLQGFALEYPMAENVVVSLLSDSSIKEIIIYGDRTIAVANSEEVSVDWRGPVTDDVLFRLYGTALHGKSIPNLLQGEYRKKRDWTAAAGRWRRAGMLAAASLATIAFFSLADGMRSLRLADRLEDRTLDLHATAFPDAVDADPRSHARAILASGGGAPVFLPISTHIAESLEEIEGVQIDRVRYNAARGEYSINLRVADVQRLEEFKRALQGRGVAAIEAGGFRRSGGFFLGEMRVSLS
ncbi:type II secretion system protein GspL [Hyphococcus flavus]|uniref:Type II secretion system protein GspL n=1 Tax=Hyphococcus flavus TaxID=1866326 RepID=A0AAF0CFP6_9PROT|nr:type II secretion system protein GspL [Hyphococcus flavus]WDI31243.1 type II secretion system protein GspL [Hyphococcus flavus]